MPQILEPKAPLVVLHEKEMGYGPNGYMTRYEWRKICASNIKTGKKQFKAWQERVKAQHIKAEEVLFMPVAAIFVHWLAIKKIVIKKTPKNRQNTFKSNTFQNKVPNETLNRFCHPPRRYSPRR